MLQRSPKNPPTAKAVPILASKPPTPASLSIPFRRFTKGSRTYCHMIKKRAMNPELADGVHGDCWSNLKYGYKRLGLDMNAGAEVEVVITAVLSAI